jgi:site-specific DNA-methyltransferase (adenine-specific)/modification methylase
MRWILNLPWTPAGVVLDPYMGSGGTGVACVQTGRDFIGVEICEDYFRVAQKRIAKAEAQLRLPI